MKNMVWKYCRSISPEWKQQVWRARTQVWTGSGHHSKSASLGSTLPLIYHVTQNGSQPLFGLMCEAEAGVGCGWKIGLTFWASSTGWVEASQSHVERLQLQSSRLGVSAMFWRQSLLANVPYICQLNSG